ncbi:SWI/SNF complex component snf12 [Apophysomyces ossiformis]|uniref:SWI/SNF complex component snf12 n=1 Tax=Apophysomyces ossiformis TaxID=679940 RepID=A0A8H7BFW4_9FUNG|nr:SWI/SNF complex component snf12 [Apophysomyces ossiformis]
MQQQPPMFQQHPAAMQQGNVMPQQGMPGNVQFRKRPSETDSLAKHIKKKRPTDRNMPPKIEVFVPESKLYTELSEFEKKLDATIMRKRLDIQEALGKPTKVKRTLRIFISNASADQLTSQQNVDEESAFDLNSGNAPSWTLKIEGRLLDPPVPTKKAQPVQKFTSFFRSIIVELERDPNLYPEGNIIEWHKQPNGTEHDGVEIKRKGDTNVNARIILDPDYNPQKFKLSAPLADLLDLKLETKPAIVMRLWEYVKNHKLQDAEDKRVIHCDPRLVQLFGAPRIHFSQLPELINHHLAKPDPIVLNYTIRVDKEFHQSPKAYDVNVELDSVVRQKMMNIVSSTQVQKEIMALDDKIVQCVQSINNSKIKRDFLMQFAQHPIEFINKWIASQARDLEVILGESKVNLEEMRQADFYKQPWVKEAVFHYLTSKTQQRMQELLNAQRGQQ